MKRKLSPDDHRRIIMRGANTRATSRLTVSGRVRGKEYKGDTAPRKVTLPKMPWDEDPGDKERGGA